MKLVHKSAQYKVHISPLSGLVVRQSITQKEFFVSPTTFQCKPVRNWFQKFVYATEEKRDLLCAELAYTLGAPEDYLVAIGASTKAAKQLRRWTQLAKSSSIGR